MGKSTEQQILDLLRSKDGQAKGFRLLVDQYSEPLYWKIRSIVIMHDDADDVLQNTLMKAWQHLQEFRGDASLSTWLYRIAVNESLDWLRSQKKDAVVSHDADGSLCNQLLADKYFDGDRAQALLQEAIAQLPDVQRAVFTLRYYDEMPYREMSLLLSTTEGALKASYHIAMKKITHYVQSHQ